MASYCFQLRIYSVNSYLWFIGIEREGGGPSVAAGVPLWEMCR